MAKYSHDEVVPFRDSQLGKKQQVADMFDRIAFRYDFLNRFLSGGIDLYWRRRAIRELSILKKKKGRYPLHILDVATGTGDMAIMLTKYIPSCQVTGIDISGGMLEIGRQKVDRLKLSGRIELVAGDSEAIQLPDHTFDAITVAFGVRNFENLDKGLQEMWRVLKPGGRLVVLECTHPRMPGVRQIYALYMRLVAPKLGKMVSSSREAYQYLNDSVRAFPEGKDFVGILERNGYTRTGLRRLSLGVCTLYTGEKAGN
jgi:demethylmenaquinone methyltransferase/2-methoxy-6-polyprenyl-1,4-benzoquinol methylase